MQLVVSSAGSWIHSMTERGRVKHSDAAEGGSSLSDRRVRPYERMCSPLAMLRTRYENRGGGSYLDTGVKVSGCTVGRWSASLPSA